MINLDKVSVLLGSKSPRRKRILEDNLSLTDFTVVASDFAEDLQHDRFASPADYCLETAWQKACRLVDPSNLKSLITDDCQEWLLICADSICVHGGRIIEKPASIDECRRWLAETFRGSVLEAISGVVLIHGRGLSVLDMAKGTESTMCRMWDYPIELVDDYLARYGELALNVSGGIAVSGPGAFMTAGYDGCFFNVAGLPVKKFYELLAHLH